MNNVCVHMCVCVCLCVRTRAWWATTLSLPAIMKKKKKNQDPALFIGLTHHPDLSTLVCLMAIYLSKSPNLILDGP